jgi:hypothetical protein
LELWLLQAFAISSNNVTKNILNIVFSPIFKQTICLTPHISEQATTERSGAVDFPPM